MDPETADALIERLPPGWDQLATKTDLKDLGADLRGEMAGLESRVGRDLRTIMFTIVGFSLAMMAMLMTIIVSGVPVSG